MAGEPAGASKGLANPLFPYCVSVPDDVLRELGYTPLHNLYVAINLDKENLSDGTVSSSRRARATSTPTAF